MNMPRLEFVRGILPGDSLPLAPRELIRRRLILIHAPPKEPRQALVQLHRLKTSFGIKQNEGVTFPVRQPAFPGFPLLAWSAFYTDTFAWSEEGLAFASFKEARERQKSHPKEFDAKQQLALQACDITECMLPAEQVEWQVLLLLRPAAARLP